MPKLILILMVMLFSTNALWAAVTGTITGKVTDAKTKEALPGVNVRVMGTPRGAATDAEGRFTIADVPADVYRLQFSLIGYETVTRTDVVVNSARPTTILQSMSEQALAGQETTVRASYFSRQLETPTSELSLSREEIRRFPGGFEDIVRTMATLPGVSQASVGGGRNDLLVRGGGPAENLYIVNNIEAPNINHFGTQGFSGGALSFVNLDFVDATTFSTGGFGVRYGDKMSSVLDLELRPGRSDRLGGKATISATQFGLNVEGPLSRHGSFLFSARKSYLDLIFKAAGLPFVPVYTDFNFFGEYSLSPNDQLTVLNLTAVDRVERDMSSLEKRVKNAGLMDNTQNQFVSGVNYRHIFRAGFFDLTVNHTLNDYQFSQVDENERKYFETNAEEQELGLKLASTLRASKRLTIHFGGSFKNGRNDNDIAFADTVYNRSGRPVPIAELGLPQNMRVDASANRYAGYAEIEPSVWQHLTVRFGLRADYYDFIAEPTYVAPRLAIGYRVTEFAKFKLNLGRYYQAPSYVWVVNPINEKLKALRNDMAIFGVDYLLQSDLNLSLETYYKKYADLPTGATPETNYLVLTNTGASYGGREDDFQSFGYLPLESKGEGEAYGFEMLLQKKFSEVPCYGQISLAYSKSEYTAGNGKTYPSQFDRHWIFNLSGGYKFNARWEVSGKFRLLTGAPYTPVYRPSENGGDIQNLPDEYLSKRLDTSHQLDLRVDRRFNFSRWAMILFLDVQNVYNYKTQYLPQYDAWEDKIEDRDQLGLLPSIGISAEF